MPQKITGVPTPQPLALSPAKRAGAAPDGAPALRGAVPLDVQNGPGIVHAIPNGDPTKVTFEPRQMGGVAYSRETKPLPWSSLGILPTRLQCLLGDGMDVTFHRVEGIAAKLHSNHTYTFLGRDPAQNDQALVAVKLKDGRREVYEMTFDCKVLGELALQIEPVM